MGARASANTINHMLQIIALTELFVCWVAWSVAFVEERQKAAGQKRVVRAPASRWGILLELVGFALVRARVRPVGFEKSAVALLAAMVLGPPWRKPSSPPGVPTLDP